jgi:hypothetical protein
MLHWLYYSKIHIRKDQRIFETARLITTWEFGLAHPVSVRIRQHGGLAEDRPVVHLPQHLPARNSSTTLCYFSSTFGWVIQLAESKLFSSIGESQINSIQQRHTQGRSQPWNRATCHFLTVIFNIAIITTEKGQRKAGVTQAHIMAKSVLQASKESLRRILLRTWWMWSCTITYTLAFAHSDSFPLSLHLMLHLPRSVRGPRRRNMLQQAFIVGADGVDLNGSVP